MARHYKGPKSDHFDGKRFFNPWNPRTHSTRSVIKWRMSSQRKPWPTELHLTTENLPPDTVEGNEIYVTFIGHSTVLLQTGGFNILTDPVWSKRAGPFNLAGPKRVIKPGIDLEDLPKVDLILVSHNHYDHLDIPTLKKILKRDHPRVIVPLGNDVLIQRKIPKSVPIALDWGESLRLHENLSVHLEPAQHWSARSLWDKNRALWGSFVIETAQGKIYFAGDTGYGEHFKKTFERHGPMKLALLPIGAYEPRWFMHYSHMNPEEAVLAHKDLGEPATLGIHFGTFPLTDEGHEDPVSDLAQALKKNRVPSHHFRALSPGEIWTIE